MKPALVVALVVLVLVGGFMALDRTVLHWYSPEGPNVAETQNATEEAPAFTADDVLGVALPQVAQLGNFPQGFEDSVSCHSASLRANGLWIVTCEYGHAGSQEKYPRTFIWDSKTGRIAD